MNTTNHQHHRKVDFQSPFTFLAAGGVLLLVVIAAVSSWAADDSGLTDKAREAVKETKSAVNGAVQDTKKAVTDAGQATAENLESLWQRVDESRLKNRTRDEIVAWFLMGMLVGSVAGMMTSPKASGLGKAGRLLLG